MESKVSDVLTKDQENLSFAGVAVQQTISVFSRSSLTILVTTSAVPDTPSSRNEKKKEILRQTLKHFHLKDAF